MRSEERSLLPSRYSNLKIGGVNRLQRGTIERVEADPHLMAMIDDAAAETVLLLGVDCVLPLLARVAGKILIEQIGAVLLQG